MRYSAKTRLYPINVRGLNIKIYKYWCKQMYVHLSEIEILIIENIIAMETRKRNCFDGWKIVSIYDCTGWCSGEWVKGEDLFIPISILYSIIWKPVQDAFTDRLWNFREMFIVFGWPMGAFIRELCPGMKTADLFKLKNLCEIAMAYENETIKKVAQHFHQTAIKFLSISAARFTFWGRKKGSEIS